MDAFSIMMRTGKRTESPKKKLRLSPLPAQDENCNRHNEQLKSKSSTGASRFTKCCVCSQNIAHVLLNDHLNVCLSSINTSIPSRRSMDLDGIESTVDGVEPHLTLHGVHQRENLTREAVRQDGSNDHNNDHACEEQTSQEEQDIQSHSFVAWLDSQGSVMSSPPPASQPEVETPQTFRQPLTDTTFTFRNEDRNTRVHKFVRKPQLVDSLYCLESFEETDVQNERLPTGNGPEDLAPQDSLRTKDSCPLEMLPHFPIAASEALTGVEPIEENNDSNLIGGMAVGTKPDQTCEKHQAGLLSFSKLGEGMAPASRNETRQMSSLGDKPSKPINLLEEERHQQARISLHSGRLPRNSDHMEIAKACSFSILQPGMVLIRNRLSLLEQQRIVKESQAMAQQFYRPKTGGGRKYHLYSAAWGPRWDGGKLQFVPDESSVPLPDWLFTLARDLAAQAHSHSPVMPSQSSFTPDVGLINYYPAKAGELGVVALGGHQDVDDTCHMPVVSVSVGDSMTFFYRRLPPFSRRKSGVRVSMDSLDAQDSPDGDAAHNSEHSVVLRSGDVLVFGGQSRMVYHGTRNLQPGSKPLGLRMAPGRLNFTFRQRDEGKPRNEQKEKLGFRCDRSLIPINHVQARNFLRARVFP